MTRLFVSAAHRSSGKTTVSLGLAAAFRARGLKVRPFKKGPDFIDPLWLGRAAGRPCYNLDFNTQSQDEIRALFARALVGADLALIEGNKGLHDGMDIEGRDSSAGLARLLDAPVLLVLDVTGITRGVAAVLAGQAGFDPEVAVRGVVLNRVVSARQETKLRQALERYSAIPVLGALPREQDLIVKERHLGLTTPGDSDGADLQIESMRRRIEQGVDLDRVLTLAREAAPWPRSISAATSPPHAADVVIGVARDAAFCFYYEDDLDALSRAGARLEVFSPLTTDRLPPVDALFIGGGFPETHLGALAANASLRADIRAAAADGMPIYAECGGLMYLCRSIQYQGQDSAMVGVFPADAIMHDRPQGRGLMVLEDAPVAPWRVATPAGIARYPAHEFHFARLENLTGSPAFARFVRRGDGIDGAHDGLVAGSTLAGFAHLRDTQTCRWAESFVRFVRARKATRNAA